MRLRPWLHARPPAACDIHTCVRDAELVYNWLWQPPALHLHTVASRGAPTATRLCADPHASYKAVLALNHHTCAQDVEHVKFGFDSSERAAGAASLMHLTNVLLMDTVTPIHVVSPCFCWLSLRTCAQEVEHVKFGFISSERAARAAAIHDVLAASQLFCGRCKHRVVAICPTHI